VAGIPDFRVGQTDPAFNWIFVNELGNSFTFAAGTTFTMNIENSATLVSVLGTGTFDTTNMATGNVLYSWGSTDSAIAGTYNLYVGYTTPAGKQGYSKNQVWTVAPINRQT
jgi:hypothetical protein